MPSPSAGPASAFSKAFNDSPRPLIFFAIGSGILTRFGRTQLQADESSFGVREIADNLAKRFRQLSHERGNGHDLVARRQLGFLQEIHDLNRVASRQMGLAYFL